MLLVLLLALVLLPLLLVLLLLLTLLLALVLLLLLLLALTLLVSDSLLRLDLISILTRCQGNRRVASAVRRNARAGVGPPSAP